MHLKNRYLILVLFPALFLISPTSAVDLSCEFKTKTDWWAIDNVYFCEQDSDIYITKFRPDILRVDGIHKNHNSNFNVKGFRIDNHQCRFFPGKLANFFPNLVFIAIWEAELNEVHQKDFAPFSELRVLSIWKNNLQTLERNLLKYNSKLEYIGLGQNKIKFIDGRIFNHMKNLHSLHFDGNACWSRQVGGNKHDVWDMVEEIEEKCSKP